MVMQFTTVILSIKPNVSAEITLLLETIWDSAHHKGKGRACR